MKNITFSSTTYLNTKSGIMTINRNCRIYHEIWINICARLSGLCFQMAYFILQSTTSRSTHLIFLLYFFRQHCLQSWIFFCCGESFLYSVQHSRFRVITLLIAPVECANKFHFHIQNTIPQSHRLANRVSLRCWCSFRSMTCDPKLVIYITLYFFYNFAKRVTLIYLLLLIM